MSFSESVHENTTTEAKDVSGNWPVSDFLETIVVHQKNLE
jgi:hypothetical protein